MDGGRCPSRTCTFSLHVGLPAGGSRSSAWNVTRNNDKEKGIPDFILFLLISDQLYLYNFLIFTYIFKKKLHYKQ